VCQEGFCCLDSRNYASEGITRFIIFFLLSPFAGAVGI